MSIRQGLFDFCISRHRVQHNSYLFFIFLCVVYQMCCGTKCFTCHC